MPAAVADTGAMGRLLVFIALAFAASVLWIRVDDYNPLEPQLEGRELVVTYNDLEGRFLRGGSFSGTHMLFGGSNDESRTGFANAHLAAINLSDAPWLMQEYPDFHRCSSPGAEYAKEMVQQLTSIAANGSVRRTLHEALDRHAESVRAGGDRVCVELAGEFLELNRAILLADGRDLTSDLQRATSHNRFAYVHQADLVDCRAPR